MPLISASVDCVKTKELPQVAMQLPPALEALHQVYKSGKVGKSCARFALESRAWASQCPGSGTSLCSLMWQFFYLLRSGRLLFLPASIRADSPRILLSKTFLHQRPSWIMCVFALGGSSGDHLCDCIARDATPLVRLKELGVCALAAVAGAEWLSRAVPVIELRGSKLLGTLVPSCSGAPKT